MRNALIGLALAAVTGISTGCYTAPVMPPVAGVYSNIQAPLDIDANESTMGSKTVKSSVVAILGLFSFGDASTAAAAREGGITTIRHLDYEYFNVLGIYQRFTTVAKGD